MYRYFQKNQCLNIKKHAAHSIQRLAYDPYAHGAPGQLLSVPMRYDGTESTDTCLVYLYIYIYMVQCYVCNLVFVMCAVA